MAAQAGSRARGSAVLAEPAEAVLDDSQAPEQVAVAEPEEAVVQVWNYSPDACSGFGAVAQGLAPAYSPMAAAGLPMDGCSAVQLAAAPTDGHPAVGFPELPDVAFR